MQEPPFLQGLGSQGDDGTGADTAGLRLLETKIHIEV